MSRACTSLASRNPSESFQHRRSVQIFSKRLLNGILSRWLVATDVFEARPTRLLPDVAWETRAGRERNARREECGDGATLV